MKEYIDNINFLPGGKLIDTSVEVEYNKTKKNFFNYKSKLLLPYQIPSVKKVDTLENIEDDNLTLYSSEEGYLLTFDVGSLKYPPIVDINDTTIITYGYICKMYERLYKLTSNLQQRLIQLELENEQLKEIIKK